MALSPVQVSLHKADDGLNHHLSGMIVSSLLVLASLVVHHINASSVTGPATAELLMLKIIQHTTAVKFLRNTSLLLRADLSARLSSLTSQVCCPVMQSGSAH